MKKKFLYFLFLTILCFGVFAEGKRIAVFNPSSEGLDASEESWLPASIRRKLESNLDDYTNCQIIELQNEDEIKSLQKKAESSSYDESTAIQLGKLVSAEYGVFITVTKANEKYILSANITNLSTGVRLSSETTDSVTECSKLFEGAGCSVNIVTVRFCSDLGCPLSTIDLYQLLKGDDLSDSEQISLTQEEIEKINKKKIELNNKLKEVNLSADIEAETQKAKLEAEKAMVEQQEQIAKERLERLQKQQEQLLQDQKDQLQRTEEQRKKIEAAAKEAAAKAEELRKKNLENLSLDSQLAVLEAKKQALVDIYQSIQTQSNAIVSAAQKEYDQQAAAIDNEPLRKGEMDSKGQMLSEVKTSRQNAKNKIKKQLEAQADSDIQELKTKTSEQIQTIEESIAEDEKTLGKKRTISSIEDSGILFVGNYAGEKYQWETTISFFINQCTIFTQNAYLNYQNVSGKNPVKPTDDEKAWDDYLDTVDLYDYMFRRQVPVISAEIDYTVEPMDISYPSTYRLNVQEFRFVDIRTGNVIQTIVPSKKSYKFTVNPAVDLSRYYSSTDNSDKKSSKKKNNAKNAVKSVSLSSSTSSNIQYDSDDSEENEESAKKQKKFTLNPDYNQFTGKGGRGILGINVGAVPNIINSSGSEGTIAIDAYVTVPLASAFYLSTELELIPCERSYKEADIYVSTCCLALYDLGVGVNLRIPVGKHYPDLYLGAACGFTLGDDIYKHSYSGKDTTLIFVKANTGLDIPFTANFGMNADYSFLYISNIGYSHCISGGFTINF